MSREILWYKDMSPAEETARELQDKTFHGSAASLSAGVDIEDIPGKGKVITLDNSGDIATSTLGTDLSTWEWGHNWTFANINGRKLTEDISGNWNDATATAYNDGGTYKIKIISPLLGGGYVVFIRGVYLTSEEFTWDNISADPYNADIVNYYSSHTNNIATLETIISLTGNPGATVQIYYIYETGQQVTQYDGLNIWPTVKYWKQGQEQYSEYWATDVLTQAIHYFWMYEQSTGRSTQEERDFLWSQFKTYVPERIPPLIADEFDRVAYNHGTNQYFRNSTIGNLPTIFKNFGIITDNDGYRCLRFHVYLPEASDGAWLGTYLGIDDLSAAPWNNLSDLSVKIKGYGVGSRLLIQLNAASINDTDKYTNHDYVYSHALPDYYTDWETFTIGFNQFWCLQGIYDDGDRARGTWYSYSNYGSVYSVEDVEEKITISGEIFYTYKKCSINSSYSYFGTGVSNLSSLAVPTGESNLNFLFKCDEVLWGSTLQVQVMQTGDVNPRTFSIYIANPGYPNFTRVTINFTSFTPNIDASKVVEYIQWQITPPNAVSFFGYAIPGILSQGDFYLADIKFGSHKKFTDLAQSLYLLQFYIGQNGISSQEFLIDDLKWGPDITDRYPFTPPLSICVTDQGLSSWQGPTLTHYIKPLTPYIQNDTTVLATWKDFIIDAQDEFNTLYGGLPGPLIPLHSRNFMEVIHYIGGENFDKFTWGSTHRNYGKVSGFWLFNEGLIDSSGNSHTLTWLGGGSPSYTTGICQPDNTAVVLDGVHSLQVNDHDDFDMDVDNFSIAIVFKTSTANKYLLNKTGSSSGYNISLNASGYIVVWVGDGTNTVTVTGATNLADDTEHLVTVRYTAGSITGLVVDVDGVALTPGNNTAIGSISNAGHLIVGADYAYANIFVGSIDYLKVWKDYAIPSTEAIDLWSNVNCTGIPLVYPECGYAWATYCWNFAFVAEYYYFTGDTDVETWLSNLITWLDTFLIEDSLFPGTPKGYKSPDWFWESGFGYGTYNPEIHAAIARGMLFYYWRTGDSTCNTWIRRILDDLRVNRWDVINGGYPFSGLNWGYMTGYLFRTWGLACNGRPDGAINPPGGGWSTFTVGTDDTEFYELFASWLFNNASNTLPAQLNADLIPYVYAEDQDLWTFFPNYISRAGFGSTEALVNFISGALEYGRYINDYSWFIGLKDFLITSGFNLSNFTLEAWINPSSSHIGDIINKDNAYRFSINNGYPELSIYYGSAWNSIVSGTKEVDYLSWGHLAATSNAGIVTLYYNGVNVGTGTFSDLPDISSDDLIVGGVAERQFYGSIGEILIRNKASTAAEIQEDMLRWLYLESMQIIELIEVGTPSQSEPLCFCTTNESIDIISYNYLGYSTRYTYIPMGWDRSGIKRQMLGSNLTTTFNLAITDDIATLLSVYDIRGQQVVIKSTYNNADHANPDNTRIIFIGELKSWTISNGVMEVTARDSLMDLGGQIPPAYFDYFCRHYFKKNRCLYGGSETECQKTETFCDSLNNVKKFGGFKFVPRLMRRKGY